MKFLKKEDRQEPGFTIGVLLSRAPVPGDVGIEIEVEGNKFPKVPGMEGAHQKVQMSELPYWSYVHDGSLRGQDNAEYVLSRPIKFDEVEAAVSSLFTRLTQFGSVIADSNRTSVHVHLNAQNFHMNRLATFLAIYFSVEEVLSEYCGEHRVGNLFCLRGKDAPAIVTQLRRFIKSDGQTELRDNLHYAGLNAHALTKYGSLEVRMMRGVKTAKEVTDWVSILRRIYELSAEYNDPREICDIFSQGGPGYYFDTIFGEYATLIRQGVEMSEDMIRDSMYDGIRLAQDICFCRDWSLFKKVDVAADPFGRDSRKMAAKLAEAAGVPQAVSAQGGLNQYYTNALASIANQAFAQPAPTPVSWNNPFSDSESDFDVDDNL